MPVRREKRLSIAGKAEPKQPSGAEMPAAELAEALRRAEERLELVLRGANLGLWEWTVDGDHVAFNARAAAMIGYDPAELDPNTGSLTSLLHPDDQERVLAQFTAHLRGETPHYESEHRLRSKSGEWVWVLVGGKVVQRGPDGRPLRAMGTQFAIGDRKRSEEERATLLELARELSGTLGLEELVASVERRTAAALPAKAVATIYWDTDAEAYRLLSQYGMPPALERMARRMRFPLGNVFEGRLAGGEMLVVDEPSGCGPRERDAMQHFGLAALAAVPLMIRGQMRGAFVAGSTTPRAFTVQQGRFLEAIARQLAVAIETSALYRTQQAETEYSTAMARIGQELISSLATRRVYTDLCRATAAVLACDISSTFLWSADGAYAATATYGDSPEGTEAVRVVRLTAVMMRPLLAALAPTGLVRLHEVPADDAVRRALEAAHGTSQALLVALRRGNDVIGFHYAGWRQADGFTRQQERIARGIGQIASLALESARLVEELERANRVKSDFVATMSHELRTPLNVVIGYHDLLLEGEFGELTAEQADRLRRADHSARELLDLINATLDLSRLEARRMPVQVGNVDVRATLEELDVDIAALRRKPGVALQWSLPPALPVLRTDAVKLKVVLKNLIHNALKFTDAGAVTVSVAAGPDRLDFEVADTGIGIPAHLLSVIFEPFRQGDSSSTRSYGGAGLGLYIVRRLVDLLGGGISVTSEVGHGSQFTFWLPLGEPRKETNQTLRPE